VTEGSISRRTAWLAVGGLGLLLSGGYLVLALQLPFGQMEQPGAAVFPLVVAAVLALASLATLHEGWQTDPTLRIDLPVGGDRRRVLAIGGLLVGYVVLLPWLGQAICSLLFLVFALRALSEQPWPRVLVTAAALAAALYVLFVLLLKVPMPKGVLGF